jgi:uncharacterized membrane protein
METLHPVAVHFAIVLPLVALSFQGLYLLKKEMAYSKATLVILVFAALFTVAAYFTGVEDAQSHVAEILSVYDEKGMQELKAHANLGLYLLIITSLIAILKLVNNFVIRKKVVDVIVFIALLATSAMMLVQGNEGGEVVYEHGTLFEGHEMKDVLKESLSEVKDAEDDAEALEIYKDAIKSALKIEE